MTDSVILEIEGATAYISFNRPLHMNTYDLDTAGTLTAHLEKTVNSRSIRAIVLKGNGDLFMAGGDVQFFSQNFTKMTELSPIMMAELRQTIQLIQYASKPVLAAVHGSVAGVGLSLMLACDLVLAAKGTKFTTAYSKLALSPDGGMSYFLPRTVGLKKAMELFMLSEVFDTETALHLGLINWQCEADEFSQQTQQLAQRLSNAPTNALSVCKQLLNDSCQHNLSQQLSNEETGFVKCVLSDDFEVGVQAFLRKETPVFQGR